MSLCLLLWREGGLKLGEAATLGLGLGTMGLNLLVLVIALGHIQLRTRLSQIFVVSMTAADLVFGLVYLMPKPYMPHIPLALCGPYYVLVWSCSMGSVLFLLFLNVDKFIALYYPLHYPQIVTESRVRLQVPLLLCPFLAHPLSRY